MKIYVNQKKYADKSGKHSEIKEIVDNPEWQTLRRSFIGTWKETPQKNILRLRSYLGDKPWTDFKKLRRVLNYLTGSGFRTKQISHSTIDGLLGEVKVAIEKVRK